MLSGMNGHSRWARILALVWAMVQVLSPGASAIADGMLARENAAAPLAHVEATGSATCPEVHSPDCGVCRYLSTGGEMPAAAAPLPVARRVVAAASQRGLGAAAGARFLPLGRAPPLV